MLGFGWVELSFLGIMILLVTLVVFRFVKIIRKVRRNH